MIKDEINAAMTYIDDGSGKIVPGPDVGIPAKEQPDTGVSVGQPNSEVAEFAQGKAAANGTPGVDLQPSEQTVTEQPVTEQKPVTTQTTTPYLYDWASGMSFNDAYKQNKHNAREIMDDQRRWAQENGKPLNIYDWITYLEHDPNKTKEQNEKDQEKAEKKKKWDALSTFLTHLGNAVGAAGWGGSVKLHDPVEMSERQRKIFDSTQALRRQRNKDMMDAYMKQYNTERQARLDETRAQNDKRRLDQRDEDIRIRSRAQEWKEQSDQGKLDFNKEKLRLDNAYRDRKMSLEEYKASISALNAATASFKAHSSESVTTTEKTPLGDKLRTVVRKRVANNGNGNDRKSLGIGLGKK